MDKKWMILICFFSVVTFISSVICSCLVFLNEKARTDVNSSQVLAGNDIYKNTIIIYNRNNNLNISGIEPGWNNSHTFTITNNNSNTIKYNLEWANVITTWNYSEDGNNHPEEFVYSVSCSNGEKVENKTMPITEDDYIIFEDLELKTNKTNECTIKVSFNKKEEVDQSYNLNKSFAGTYKFVIKE